MRKRAQRDAKQGIRRRKGDRRHFTTTWMRRQSGRVYYGPDSISLVSQKLKYIRSGPYFPYTPGELARLYLAGLMHDQLGRLQLSAAHALSEREKALLEIPAPLYFEPKRGREGRFVYVDIAACYFELFAPVPLNLAYNPATDAIGWPRPALRIPKSDWPWLRAEKPLRHALFGMMSTCGVTYFQDGQPHSNQFKGPYTAPDLCALVKTRLHRIASTAVEDFGCRMWLTDAGIFEEADGLRFQLWLATRGGDSARCRSQGTGPPHGTRRIGADTAFAGSRPALLSPSPSLLSRPKASGKGHLWALGDYRVGHLRTLGQHVDMPPYSNLTQTR